MDENLYHVGVLGMKWGRRKGSSNSSGTKRKTSYLPTNKDGRKVNKLFGAVNRKKIRNWFLGDPDKFIRDIPGMKKKYDSLSPKKQEKMRKIVDTSLATIGTVSMAALGYMLLKQ